MRTCVAALKNFETIGCTVDAARPDFAMDRLWDTWLTLRAFLVAGALGPLYADPASRALMKPEAIWEVERGSRLSGQDVFKASVDRTAWYHAVERLFRRFDYLVLPSAQVFAFDAGTPWPRSIAGRTMDTYHRWMEVVVGGTLAGLPILCVPAGFGPQGQPIGLQVMGRPRADRSVLELGDAYEKATSYTSVRSPLAP